MGGELLSNLLWQKPLLQIEFYNLCECESSKQCSFFYRDCTGSAFCEECLYHPRKHVGHQNLRVYKSSSIPGLRVHSIRNLMGVSDIQPHTCNSSKLVYINKKRRKEHENHINGGKVEKCEVCGYEIQYLTSKFCSIECKAPPVEAALTKLVDHLKEDVAGAWFVPVTLLLLLAINGKPSSGFLSNGIQCNQGWSRTDELGAVTLKVRPSIKSLVRPECNPYP
ncbi:Detected protein of unknown function [Hibiscus syriacus]|uniref:PLATZ transcription factor family protein n=1 Tax=Hibiscus syriacus TaxID=106335 RepID=A0A6A3AFM4_HIBSY|nr:Detected protein of unknown function [Hibiscus syriacus]